MVSRKDTSFFRPEEFREWTQFYDLADDSFLFEMEGILPLQPLLKVVFMGETYQVFSVESLEITRNAMQLKAYVRKLP